MLCPTHKIPDRLVPRSSAEPNPAELNPEPRRTPLNPAEPNPVEPRGTSRNPVEPCGKPGAVRPLTSRTPMNSTTMEQSTTRLTRRRVPPSATGLLRPGRSNRAALADHGAERRSRFRRSCALRALRQGLRGRGEGGARRPPGSPAPTSRSCGGRSRPDSAIDPRRQLRPQCVQSPSSYPTAGRSRPRCRPETRTSPWHDSAAATGCRPGAASSARPARAARRCSTCPDRRRAARLDVTFRRGRIGPKKSTTARRPGPRTCATTAARRAAHPSHRAQRRHRLRSMVRNDRSGKPVRVLRILTQDGPDRRLANHVARRHQPDQYEPDQVARTPRAIEPDRTG